jgi:hypothetical protein
VVAVVAVEEKAGEEANEGRWREERGRRRRREERRRRKRGKEGASCIQTDGR